MIFLQLFLVFLKIGIFTFGGGYAMIALIENEVVGKYHWLSTQQFTDLVAISQMTPGPIGINTATYAGYEAVFSAGYSQPWAVLGALVASFAVVLLPVTFTLIVYRFLLRYKDNPVVQRVLATLRLVIVGLIASAALTLLNGANFGSDLRQVFISVVICLAVFLLSVWPKKEGSRRPGPIALILMSGALGLILY